MREKFEVETRELENSERRAVQKYNQIKVSSVEEECFVGTEYAIGSLIHFAISIINVPLRFE